MRVEAFSCGGTMAARMCQILIHLVCGLAGKGSMDVGVLFTVEVARRLRCLPRGWLIGAVLGGWSI
jgi:hypothetical protein